MTTTATRPALAADAAGALPVGSYARRSRKASGDGKGAFINIADQHAQNRAYAAVEFPGAPVIEYDDNMSAWDPNVTREDWERLLEDTRDGQLRAVVGRYADRLTRQPEQGEALLSACRVTGTELHTTSGGHITSALMFRIELALAAEESDVKARRMKDTHRRLAAAGQFQGGKRRFGYTRDMTATIPAEAERLKDAALRVLAGESLNSITTEWNGAGVRTSTGAKWRPQSLGRILRNAYPAGLTHDGRPAKWEAVYDVATREALTHILSDAGRVASDNNGVRVYALSGLLTCGECDGPMGGRPTPYAYGSGYFCRNGYCTQAPTERVEYVARELVIGRLSTVDAAGVFVPPADVDKANARAATRAGLVAAREAMPDQLGVLSPADYTAGLAAIDKGLAALDAEAAAEDQSARVPLRVLKGLTGHPIDVTARLFDALPWDRQRAVIAALGSLSLARPSRKGPRLPFEPARVRPLWRPTA